MPRAAVASPGAATSLATSTSAVNSPTGMCDPDEDFHSDLEFDEDPDEFGGMEIDDGDYPWIMGWWL